MTNQKKPIDQLLNALQERVKELNCLYQIEEILSQLGDPIEDVCRKIIQAIPPGWQYPEACRAKITIEDQIYQQPGFQETHWVQCADIVAQNMVIGSICVYYTKQMPPADDGPFLKEETKLIRTIAERLGHFIIHHRMKRIAEEFEAARGESEGPKSGNWQAVLEMLKQTDRILYLSIARRMLNHLSWSGISEAETLLQSYSTDESRPEEESRDNWNQPDQKRFRIFTEAVSAAVLKIAGDNINDDEILRLIQKWIQEDKLSFLDQVVSRNLTLSGVSDTIRRYYHLTSDDPGFDSPSLRGIHVSLIRRFLSDQLQYINVAKNFVKIRDFYHLLERMVFSTDSYGKLGGKSAGLYLAARILEEKGKESILLANVKIPKTWHITSDILGYFMHYNDFDEVVEQKYKEINQIRTEYPHVVQSFKSGKFPGDIIKGLSMALDDFGDHPLIVRSSSLLEDRIGASFSGKYKSLFLANQGSKSKRLDALMDAIAEVYASTFSPDPIEYRTERGLLDFSEEMGIIIQEVVGYKTGNYFFPAFAGVAFSNNEFRWSPRIKRKDGLVRLVPGLGTRAVDRLSDDYPVLIAPGQPCLRANVSADETARYSPRKIDVINLKNDCFETLDLKDFLKMVGHDYPNINNIISIFSQDQMLRPADFNVDFEKDTFVVTFEGLISRTPFVKQVQEIITTLEDVLGTPADIEFASDGRDFYLLQCRAQSYSADQRPAPIPKDIAKDQLLFSAKRYISNGQARNLTHIVYIDPDKYSELPEREDLIAVGRAVSKLNKLLPKRKFILMGPGRWGSRGDIRLGVNVTYSDINNTAVLIEIARKKGQYLPELSFGTHFFQDLVEANIRYLPLYPDDEQVSFNEVFLQKSKNILSDVLPEFSSYSDTIRLIDVPKSSNGLLLHVLMNADLDEAVGILAKTSKLQEPIQAESSTVDRKDETFWQWRLKMAERIAKDLEPDRFGVVALYVFGSTKNASAGPGSDIDLLVHFRG
ncbi:MAG: PEP/pyruvate-binding domain-containing protein, partial [Candidatus Latescibacterota bacterium]